MPRLRALLWLIALAAFALPPLGGSLANPPTPAHASMQHGSATDGMAVTDCDDHAPPPPDCPAKGTAKHAAGTCCPLMAGVVGVLPPAAAAPVPPAPSTLEPAGTPRLGGLAATHDPPPPRR